jgi:hypothetical protein
MDIPKRTSRPRLRGLGDVVALVAQPVARVIDRFAGTGIEHCGGCAKRRAALNATFSLSTKPNQ